MQCESESRLNVFERLHQDAYDRKERNNDITVAIDKNLERVSQKISTMRHTCNILTNNFYRILNFFIGF